MIIKIDETYTDKTFSIQVHNGSTYHIQADCLQDALDDLIDYWEDNRPKYDGLFIPEAEIMDYSERDLDELLRGGNRGIYTSVPMHELHCIEL